MSPAVGGAEGPHKKRHRIAGLDFDQGSYTTLDVPGSIETGANGINASGQIVGWYRDAGGTHGFLATPVP
jgi:hypothetical protein